MKNRTVSSKFVYLEPNESVLKCNCAASSISVYLNPARDYQENATIIKVDDSVNVVTIYPHGNEAIDGTSSVTLSRLNDRKTLVPVDGGWATSADNSVVSAQLARKVAKKPIAVATRCTAHHTGTTLAGTVAGVTYRYAHVMRTKATNLQLVFANFYPTATSESSNANAINVAVTLEYNGQTTRLHFGGKRVVTIDQGGIAETDTFMRDIPEGATFYTRTWISVPVDGNTYPQGIACNSALGDGKGTGDLAVATGALTASTEQGYGPSAIIGIPDDDNAVAFALIGDSIVADGNGKGWPVQSVENDYGYMILSRPSSTVDSMEFTSGNAYRYRMIKYATHAICDYGTNDFNNANPLNDVIGRFGDMWDVLKAAGLITYHSTTLPRTTSTDSWATTGNQTAVSANSYNTKRATFNANLRNGEYPVRVLDIASAAETVIGATGVWKAAYTADGIHPIQAGIDAMVTNINLGL